MLAARSPRPRRTWSSASGYCEAGRTGDRYNSAVCLHGDGVLGTHRKVHLPAGESAAYAPGDTFARVRHPGRPDGHADRLRQDVPRVGAHPRPRRRGDRRLPVGLADERHQPRAEDGPGPPVAAVRPLRPRPGRREPDRAGVVEPDRCARRDALPRSGQGRRARPATSSRGPGRRPGSPSPSWTSRPRSRWPAGCCATSTSAGPRATWCAREDRPAHLFDEAARRRRAHARAGRGAGRGAATR